MSAGGEVFAGGGALRPLFDRARSRGVDRALIAAGMPGVLLMENAGRGAADAIAGLARERSIRAATVVIGPGNNGGDGLVVARHLRAAGLDATVFSLGDPAALTGDAAVMRDAWRAVGGAIERVPGELTDDTVAWPAAHAPLVVDALFGTGLNRALEGNARAAVARINAARRALTVALDLPSGLDAETGAPLGDALGVVRATHTLTFGTSKPGLHTGSGRVLAGQVDVIGLGAPVPPPADPPDLWLAARAPLEPRRLDAHKGDNGHVLVVGGSAGKTGAALLAARGAHRAGAGLVTVASRAGDAVDLKVVETMTLALGAAPDDAVHTLGGELARFDVVAIGPGLGRDDWARAVFDAVLARARAVVVDADGLALLRDRGHRPTDAALVLTPHPLEMARLLDEAGGAEAVNADRVRAARACAARYGAVAVLKGAGTLVASPHGVIAFSPYGEPTLGVAGSGDVLAGAVAARLAERRSGLSPSAAALQAVLAHGRAGERVRAERGSSRGALATEIADALSTALEEAAGDHA